MNFLMMPAAKMASVLFIVKAFWTTGQQKHRAAARSLKTVVRIGALA